MPRVHTATRKRAVLKHAMVCRHCREEIAVGQEYYSWERRYGGKQHLHTSCRRPRPTELSSRKTAAIEEAVMDASFPEASFDMPSDGSLPEAEAEGYLTDLRSVLEDVAGVVRDVGEQYQDAFDNLPENFQYGATGEALQQVAEACEEKASDLESFDFSADEPDWPEREDEESDEDFRGRVEETFDAWAQDMRSEAEDALSDMPEYEG